jgi:hypothetical protein
MGGSLPWGLLGAGVGALGGAGLGAGLGWLSDAEEANAYKTQADALRAQGVPEEMVHKALTDIAVQRHNWAPAPMTNHGARGMGAGLGAAALGALMASAKDDY